MGSPVDEVRALDKLLLADELLEIAAGVVGPGTVCASRWEFTGLVGGRPLVTLGGAYAVAPGSRARLVSTGMVTGIDSRPEIAIDVGLGWNRNMLLSTATHAVNALPAVCDSAAGVRSVLDLPVVTGRCTVTRLVDDKGGMTMEIGIAFLGAPRDAAVLAAEAEQAGADAFLCGETDNVAAACALAAALHTSRIRVGTSVTLAFARSPVLAAMECHGLAQSAPGRAIYGIGSQIRQVVERRFSADFDPAVARMAEYGEVMRRAARALRGETVEPFEGRFYRVSQYTFHAVPELDLPDVPLYLGAVGPQMLGLAARSFDGVVGHGVATRRYLTEVVRPAIGNLPLTSAVMTSLVGDRDEARSIARRIVAFYGTTPAYEPAFEIEGRGELPRTLRRLFRSGDVDEMTALVDDDLVDAFVLTGRPDEVVERLREYEDVLDCAVLGGVGVGATRDEILRNNRGLIEVCRAYRAAG